jgi:surface antigen
LRKNESFAKSDVNLCWDDALHLTPLFQIHDLQDKEMNMNKLLITGLIASSLSLAGCQTNQEQTGQVIGAIAGGVLGNQVGSGSGRVAATIAGTMLGGYLGGQVGRTMDENDRYRANQALDTSPTNQTVSWHNPDTGNNYAVTPTKTFYENSQPCREYTTEAWIGGKKETVYGTACRQPDGSWQAAN